MLTDYLLIGDYIAQAVAKAEEAGATKDLDRLDKAKGNIETVFLAIADCGDTVPVLRSDSLVPVRSDSLVPVPDPYRNGNRHTRYSTSTNVWARKDD